MSKGWPVKLGIVDIRPGRSTPLIRPTTKRPAAKRAPVFPAEITASAAFSLTACAPKTIEAFFFLRIALAGSSSEFIFSSVCTMLTRSFAVK